MTDDASPVRASRSPVSAVLVTGGTGSVGSLALRALADRGVEHLVSLDVRDPREPQDGVVYLTEDIRTPELPGMCLAACDGSSSRMNRASFHAKDLSSPRARPT